MISDLTKISLVLALAMPCLAAAGVCGQPARTSSCGESSPQFAGFYLGEGIGLGRANLRIGNADGIRYKDALAGIYEAGYNWTITGRADLVIGLQGHAGVIRSAKVLTPEGDKSQIGHKQFGLSLLLGVPSGPWMPYVKLGFGRTKSNGDYRYDNNDNLFAAGMEYKVNENWGVNATYQQTLERNKSDTKPIPTARSVTVGLRYYFDSSDALTPREPSEEILYQATPKRASTSLLQTTPTPLPPSPPPDAQLAAAKPSLPPRNERVVLPSDDFFYWRTKYAILPEGKRALDLLADKLAGLNYQQVAVSAYTDYRDAKDFKKVPKGVISRETQQTSNDQLTQIRAESIRDYLVKETDKKIPLQKVVAMGKSAEGATMTAACRKLKPSKQAACLAPDRRIVVEVFGITP